MSENNKTRPHGFRRDVSIRKCNRCSYRRKADNKVRFIGQDTVTITQLLAYVANFSSDTVSVVDILEGEEITAIPVGRNPYDLDISPDKKYLFVSNFGEDTLSVICIADNREVARVNLNQPPFTADQPSGVAVSLDGKFIYVANFDSSNVSIVRNVEWAWKVIGEIPLPSDASEIAITPDGRFAYVTLPDIDRVAVVDLEVNLPVEILMVGDDPEDVAINRNSLAFVTNQRDDNLSAINTLIAEVSDVPIPVGDFPTGVAFNPAGSIAYVANQGDNTVSVVSVFGHEEIQTIPVGEDPFGVAVSPNGRYTVVANEVDGTVSIIDNAIRQVVDTVDVGLNPTYLKIIEVKRRVYRK